MWKKETLLCWLAALMILPTLSVAQDLSDPSYVQPALDISRKIQARHLPFDTITDPIFATATSEEIVVATANYGDSAIWSGHYLAAEAYRFAVTGEDEAFDFALRVLGGIHRLLNVGGPGLLARFAIPADASAAAAVTCQRSNPILCSIRNCRYEDAFENVRYAYVDNVSRDQYMGVLFGLAVAYELIPDESVQLLIRQDVAAIIDYLTANDWTVVYRDGCVSTTFILRPEQILSILQVGKLVWPERYSDLYERNARDSSSLVSLPILTELLDKHNSYFKFNLDHIALFNLTRLEADPVYFDRYFSAFALLRDGLRDHQNAHFNALEIGVTGDVSGPLVSQTKDFLRLWLQRPRRNVAVINSTRCSRDIRCMNDPSSRQLRAADPLPVHQRPPTDFLWQRSPYQLDGGGDGRMELTGIDYILPYWMLRYYIN